MPTAAPLANYLPINSLELEGVQKKFHLITSSPLFFTELKRWRGLLLPFLLLAGWAFGSTTRILDPSIFPSPEAVWKEASHLASRGELTEHLHATFLRVFFGFGLGAVSATLIGSLTGFSSSARAYLDPFLQAIRNIPSMAWVPVFILWFGIAETGKIALVALGGFFPVYLNLMEGIRSVDRKLIEAAWVCGFRGYRLFYSIYFRSTLACYMVGLRQGLALAWMFVVAAEIMGSSCGLGYLLVDGESTGRLATLIVSFILFAICGKFTDALLVLASDHILYWRDITSKN